MSNVNVTNSTTLPSQVNPITIDIILWQLEWNHYGKTNVFGIITTPQTWDVNKTCGPLYGTCDITSSPFTLFTCQMSSQYHQPCSTTNRTFAPTRKLLPNPRPKFHPFCFSLEFLKLQVSKALPFQVSLQDQLLVQEDHQRKHPWPIVSPQLPSTKLGSMATIQNLSF